MRCAACDEEIDGFRDLCSKCRSIVRRTVYGPSNVAEVAEIFGLEEQDVLRNDVIVCSIEELKEDNDG